MKRFSPLLVGFLCALALHALLLSYLQLRRSRESQPPSLQSRDNTPELLQFSSQPAPLTTLDLLPLPKASPLPPPPLPALTSRKPLDARPKKGVGKNDSRKSSTKPDRSGRKPSPSRPVTAQVQARPSEKPEDLTLAREQLRSFVRQQQQPSPSPVSTFQEGEGPRDLREGEPEVLEAYQTLWKLAQPLADGDSGPPAGKGGILPWRSAGLPSRRSPATNYRSGIVRSFCSVTGCCFSG